jgi:hypothetical protein
VVPDAVKESVPVRDWGAEVDKLKATLTDAVDKNDAPRIKAVRAMFKTFESEAPPAFAQDLLAFYNLLRSQSKKESPPAPPSNVTAADVRAAQAARMAGTKAPPSATATSSPTTSATPARAAEYLPPNQRGDAYDGPDQPPPPFG